MVKRKLKCWEKDPGMKRTPMWVKKDSDREVWVSEGANSLKGKWFVSKTARRKGIADPLFESKSRTQAIKFAESWVRKHDVCRR